MFKELTCHSLVPFRVEMIADAGRLYLAEGTLGFDAELLNRINAGWTLHHAACVPVAENCTILQVLHRRFAQSIDASLSGTSFQTGSRQ